MGGCAAGEVMGKQRPEQGVLKLATDRGSRRDGGAGRAAEGGIEGGSVPVPEDLPVFEEDATVANPARASWLARSSTSARCRASSCGCWPRGSAPWGSTAGCAGSAS